MADVKFDVKASLDKLVDSMEGLSSAMEEEMNNSIRDLAHAAYAEIVSKAQSDLSSTRQDYMKALHFEDLGDNSFLISLDGAWAQKLEDGFASYDLTEVLLNSNKKVQVGQRAGQPWVRENKDGGKYAAVPLERKPFSGEAKAGDLAASIKQMTATNMAGRKQKITKLFKGLDGVPLEGKVAVATSDNPYLDNLVKYQKTYTNEAGKQTTQSTYINYRMVSENGDSWIHPGFKGVHAFSNAEKMIVENIEKILRTLTGKI